jgi:hypothetical protein
MRGLGLGGGLDLSLYPLRGCSKSMSDWLIFDLEIYLRRVYHDGTNDCFICGGATIANRRAYTYDLQISITQLRYTVQNDEHDNQLIITQLVPPTAPVTPHTV